MELAQCSSFSLYPPKFASSTNIQSSNLGFNFSQNRIRRSILCGLESNSRFDNFVVNAGEKVVEVETAVLEKPTEVQRFEVFEGYPAPFGATLRDGGVNFAIFSGHSVSASLCFISLADLQQNRVTKEISLDPLTNKTGDIWHVLLKGNFRDMLYGYKFDGPFSPEEGHYYDSSRVLLDPYAKAVISRGEFGVVGPDGNCWPQMAGMIPKEEDEFDWEGDLPLNHPQNDLVIYEMHVRGYTRHETSGTKHPGTWCQLYRVNAMPRVQ